MIIHVNGREREIKFCGSTYEARRDVADAVPFLRGINSIQLMHDSRRWRVVAVFWQAEDAAAPLPQAYL